MPADGSSWIGLIPGLEGQTFQLSFFVVVFLQQIYIFIKTTTVLRV
jgi:hypothetical protein